MAKARDKVVTELEGPGWSVEWLTRVAFVLALGLVVARVTMADVSRAREALASTSPRGAGAATQIALDLLCCVPAVLVLARRVSDRAYVLRWSWAVAPLIGLAAWGVLSTFWAADRFAALVAGFHWVAAAALVWAGVQLVRSWMRLRIVGAVVFGLLLAYFSYALLYRTIDLPDMQKDWAENKAERLKERGISDDPFLVKQFENRVMSGELIGFFQSPNTMAAVVVFLLLVTVGLGGQRRMDDREDAMAWGLLVGVPLAGWMIYHTLSRTAFLTPVMGLGLLVAAWWGRGWLAGRSRGAYWAGVGVVAVVAVAVIGHGLYHNSLFHESLTFRWVYWTGAMRVFAGHWLAGVGLDNFGLYYLGGRIAEAPEEVKDPHNLFVKFMSELGVVGLVLCVGWLGRVAWEATRGVVPAGADALGRAGQAQRLKGDYQGPGAIMVFVLVAGVGFLINVFSSVDFSADPGFVFNEILRRLAMFALLLIGAGAAGVTSLKEPELDGRPAPLLLYAMVVALGIFVVHNLIDFSLFESGPLMLFSLVTGAVLGVRQPSAAGRRKNTAAAAVGLLVCVVGWIVAAGFVWAPTAMAEDELADAGLAVRTDRPNEAVRALQQARLHQPLNADYAYRAAEVLIRSSRVYNAQVLELLGIAIGKNPMAVEYYLARARYLMAGPDVSAQGERVKADYARAVELNPNDVPIRVEYAAALARLGDAAGAVAQYEEGLRRWALLKENEPKKRMFAPRVEGIRAEVERLRGGG